MTIAPVLGALTRGRRHGQEAPGMGGVIGMCTAVIPRLSLYMLRNAADMAQGATHGSRRPPVRAVKRCLYALLRGRGD